MNSEIPNDDMLSYAEAAAFLGVKVATLYSMVARREVPFARLGKRLVRFSRAGLKTWVANRTVVPASLDAGKAVA
jgi:excisionase family DNA binding protein